MSNIIIVDSYSSRSKDIARLLQTYSEKISIITIDTTTCIEDVRNMFKEEINRNFENLSSTTIVCNAVALFDYKIMNLLYELEGEHPKTRKFLVSCLSKSQIDKQCKRKGIDRKKFKHIVASDDNTHLTELYDIFYNIG